MILEHIIKGCKEGNRKSQDALVQKYASGFLFLCQRYLPDKEMAKDALQETFISIFKNIGQFEGKGSFEGWMKRIAINTSLHMHRKSLLFGYEDIEEHFDLSQEQIPEIYGTFEREDILGLLQLLPESLYLVFNLYVIEGYQHNEIAEMLKISESTSRAALHKARMKLIKMIKMDHSSYNYLMK